MVFICTEALEEPFLIIKTSQGNTSLHRDFRSPSAVEWTPPEDHSEEEDREIIPIPEKLDLPADYVDAENVVPETAGRNTGSYLGISGMRGVPLDEMHGVHPIAVAFRAGREERVPGRAFRRGDLILGVEGNGFGEDAIEQWRSAYWGARATDDPDADWMLNVTLWREGEIKTFDFDIAETLAGGREGLPAHFEATKAREMERRGRYYRMMMSHIKDALGDIENVHPAYDAEAGYESAGFIWFQGWNDRRRGGTRPSRQAEYTWLLEHFIRDVRNDLDAPDMPFVIGVLGVGGIHTDPDYYKTHFQHAMAAPASNPEFEGTVAAVHTGKYWDHELDALRSKPDRTPEEDELVRIAVSDGAYHYLGSAKIMCGIGKGFAEAMLELLQE